MSLAHPKNLAASVHQRIINLARAQSPGSVGPDGLSLFSALRPGALGFHLRAFHPCFPNSEFLKKSQLASEPPVARRPPSQRAASPHDRCRIQEKMAALSRQGDLSLPGAFQRSMRLPPSLKFRRIGCRARRGGRGASSTGIRARMWSFFAVPGLTRGPGDRLCFPMETIMSSEGRMVIPATVRQRLRLARRTRFAIETPDDCTVLLKLSRPGQARRRTLRVGFAPVGALPVTARELEIEEFAGAPLRPDGP